MYKTVRGLKRCITGLCPFSVGPLHACSHDKLRLVNTKHEMDENDLPDLSLRWVKKKKNTNTAEVCVGCVCPANDGTDVDNKLRCVNLAAFHSGSAVRSFRRSDCAKREGA